ncbi:MAG: pilus assembly protein, partial [Thiotrichales bacterium]|nr:pilus assembly protein [Thiotrichales bacterium]
MFRFRRQSGQSATEFIIVTPLLLMLIFGSMQFALLYRAKITLNYATFQAARTGAFTNANRIMMENTLARNLAALYTRSATVGTNEGELFWARDRVRQEIIDGFLWVQVLNPTDEAFNDLGLDDDGDKLIPNDNLMYREQFTSSGLTIQDANLLQIRVSYCHRMIVPYIDRLLAILMTRPQDGAACSECRGAFTTQGTFERSCFDNRRFPIHAH